MGAPLARDVPGLVLRRLHCLCVAVTIGPPRRPDKVDVLDGQRYVRKVQPNGRVQIHTSTYSSDQARRGQYVSLRIDAAHGRLVVAYGDQVLKTLPSKGLEGERLALEDDRAQLSAEARSAMLVGRPVGRHLRLL